MSDREIEVKRRHTLACAARVSKNFRNAAVPVLWDTLDSFYPIFNLLPSFRRVEGGEDLLQDPDTYYTVLYVRHMRQDVYPMWFNSIPTHYFVS